VRIDCALLCDAATAREGLLHILGGGVTRAGRQAFPSPIGLTLAVHIIVDPNEVGHSHKIEVRLLDEDGTAIGGIDGEFSVSPTGQIDPGEAASLPLPLEFPPGINLPRPGPYTLELLIDGISHASVAFKAVAIEGPPGPPKS
jgi:hypothetical protein